MSMDDQFRELELFERELDRFNQNLAGYWQDVEAKFDDVSPLWQDEYRREHDLVWDSLQTEMKRYLNQQSPRYMEFLHSKLQALSRYLRG
jgi:hypothetical protein